MILIGLGGNLPSVAGLPIATAEAALARLEVRGVALVACSPWYQSAPLPASAQPWFCNAVARVRTDLGPSDLLAALHAVDVEFGSARVGLNAARTLDLDLLAYADVVRDAPPPHLPHPRLHERAFVLVPLNDAAPTWRHPILGRTPAELMDKLPPGQLIRPLNLETGRCR